MCSPRISTRCSAKVSPSSRRSGNRGRLISLLAGLVLAGSVGLVWAAPALATTVTAPTALVRYQQSDARLSYSGTWTTVSTVNASGGASPMPTSRALR